MRKKPREALAFGGELPMGCDPLVSKPGKLLDSGLNFSNGRAALAWLIKTRGPFDAALLSAYTCPLVPQLMQACNIPTHFIDANRTEWAERSLSIKGSILVIIPSFLGQSPIVNPVQLSKELGSKSMVIVDAAQTAFAHLSEELPLNGAVLSVPRKVTGLADGAILHLDQLTKKEIEVTKNLPLATKAFSLKLAASCMAENCTFETEAEALNLANLGEAAFSNVSHRMSDRSRSMIPWLDVKMHSRRRWENWNSLASRFEGRLDFIQQNGGVPFNFSFLVDNRTSLLQKLRDKRVFATPLWPNAQHDPLSHPFAADLASRLIGIPIDQRYTISDMDELKERIAQCLPR